MQKKSTILILSLFLINLASSYNGYNSYSNFSLSDFFNSFDSQTMLIVITFIISFALINYALNRAFNNNKKFGENRNTTTPAIISFCIALFITWSVNKSGFDISGIFYSIGFSGNFLGSMLPILILLGIGFIIWKAKKASPIIIGFFLIGISYTELIYAKGLTLLLGIGLVIVGFFMNKNSRPPIPSHV